MPPPLIPQDGKVAFGRIFVPWIADGAHSAQVHLFENDYTPTPASTLVDFVECSAGGLGVMPTPPATEQLVGLTGPSNWIFDAVTFTATGTGLPTMIFGYYVDFADPIDVTRRILWCQRFDSPQAAVNAGDEITFIPNLGSTQC